MKAIDHQVFSLVCGGEARHTGGSNQSYGNTERPCGFDSWGDFDDYMNLQYLAIDGTAYGLEEYFRVPIPDGLSDAVTDWAKDKILENVLAGSKCEQLGNVGGSVVAP